MYNPSFVNVHHNFCSNSNYIYWLILTERVYKAKGGCNCYQTVPTTATTMIYYLIAALLLSATVTQALPCCGAIGLVGPGVPGAVVQGPSAHGAVVGPDGSVVAGTALGGAVVAPARHGGVVSAAIAPGHIGLGLGLGHGAILL